MAMAGARAVVAQGRVAGHHNHHPLEEEKLVAGAGMEGCVEGLATFFADLPCRQLKKPHSPAGDAALQQNN